MNAVDLVQKKYYREAALPDFRPGDTLRVHVKIKEGTRERIQVFEGIVIARQHGGLDETFEVSLNDVDFCLKLREKGYLNVFTPFAEMFHYESLSRGLDLEGENAKRYEDESEHFRTKWKEILDKGDPYYNPNFSLDRSDYSLNVEGYSSLRDK